MEWIKKAEESLKGSLLKYVVGAALVFLVARYEKIMSYIDEGREREKIEEIERIVTTSEIITEATIKKVTDPTVLSKVLESDVIARFSEETAANVEKAVAERIIRKDTNNVSMRGFIGVEADIRTEKVLPTMAELVKAWYAGEIILKSDVNKYVKAEVKRELKRLRTVPLGTEIPN